MNRLLFSLSLFFVCFSVRAEFDLIFSDAKSESFRVEMLQIIPEQMKTLIGKRVVISFTELDDYERLENPCREGTQVFGKTEGGKIFLNKNFLPFLNAEGDSYPCSHGSSRNLLMGTLIHELGHLMDRNLNYISRSKLYLALSHASGLKLKNKREDRLPDPYELKNTIEHFAVNLEYYVLDETYACRRPNLNRFYSQLLGRAERPCEFYSKANSFDLSPDEVSEIHYLIADGAKSIMSKFGHAMFRLVMKNGRDLVVGFSGQMNDATISSWKGLTGKYASKVSLKEFEDVKNEYTRTEWRGLKSYRMEISVAQKEAFIQQILTLYWEYSGKYYFLTNNCADEAFQVILAAIQDPSLINMSVLTPLDITAALKKLEIISDASMVYFPSYRSQMEKIFSSLSSDIRMSLETYSKLPSSKRKAAWPTSLTRKQLLALLSLEITFQRRAAEEVQSVILSTLDRLKETDPLKLRLKEMTRLSNSLNFGSESARGYGIPLREEIVPVTEDEKKESANLIDKLMKSYTEWAETIKIDARKEVIGSEENIQSLRDDLKKFVLR